MKYIPNIPPKTTLYTAIRNMLYFFLFAVVLTGCKPDEPETKPEEVPVQSDKTNLSFEFSSLSGGFFISNAGDTIKIAKLKFLISDFILEKTNGDLVKVPDAYGFLSLTENIDTFVIKNVPLGEYKSFWLEVGIDSIINHSDPKQWDNNHPLNPALNDMHWGWAGGYIFNIIEGYYKDNGFDKSFSFHVALDKNARRYHYVTNFAVTKNNKITMNVNPEKYFSNVVDFSLKNDGNFSHSGDPDPVMDKFIQNVGVISFLNFK